MVYYNDTKVDTSDRIEAATANAPSPRILAVGELSRWIQSGKNVVKHPQIAFADITEVDETLLETLGTEMVVSPVLCNAFDCLDLAEQLQACNFRGKYRAIAQNLPNPALVRREVKAQCPDVDFDFIDAGMVPSGRIN